MEYRRLGKSGLKVSPIILGCMSYGLSSWQPWVLDEEASLPLIKAAFDKGINTFDTADTYSNGFSEKLLGTAMKRYNIPREQVVLLTKCYNCVADQPSDLVMGLPPSQLQEKFGAQYINRTGLSRKHIIEAVDASLERLGTTYIDVLQIHRLDKEVEAEEIMSTLHQLILQGKVRYIGASSMYAVEFAKLNHVADLKGYTRFISMQNYHNLLYREDEREMMRYCAAEGIAVIPWSPLARGALARPYPAAGENTDTTRAGSDRLYRLLLKEKAQESDAKIVGVVQKIAKEKGITMAQVAIAWSLMKVTAPIVGISNMDRLDEAIAALDVSLTPEEVAQLEAEYVPRPILGHA
ncbi:Aldo/keto reductase [Protomyces lactucae-debilis]|uniref:Aldo/keto reductase n=1 Tax=Protomyces lactucae-debilis TaxID=2754530 RepID=A0A1Y2EV57_PROLT|nr:Aldo/keto reductase [Protomyces lactucae-debilis]ORY75397.1 Aldo/keto reductase [Protomyces lactucae-debilis]